MLSIWRDNQYFNLRGRCSFLLQPLWTANVTFKWKWDEPWVLDRSAKDKMWTPQFHIRTGTWQGCKVTVANKTHTVHDFMALTGQWETQNANNNYKRYLWVLKLIWMLEPGYMGSIVYGFLSPNLEGFPKFPVWKEDGVPWFCSSYFPTHNISKFLLFLFQQHSLNLNLSGMSKSSFLARILFKD